MKLKCGVYITNFYTVNIIQCLLTIFTLYTLHTVDTHPKFVTTYSLINVNLLFRFI